MEIFGIFFIHILFCWSLCFCFIYFFSFIFQFYELHFIVRMENRIYIFLTHFIVFTGSTCGLFDGEDVQYPILWECLSFFICILAPSMAPSMADFFSHYSWLLLMPHSVIKCDIRNFHPKKSFVHESGVWWYEYKKKTDLMDSKTRIFVNNIYSSRI